MATMTSPAAASPAASRATAYRQAASLMAAAFYPSRTRDKKKRQSLANEATDYSVTTGKRRKTSSGEDDLRHHNGGNSTQRHVRPQNRPTSRGTALFWKPQSKDGTRRAYNAEKKLLSSKCVSMSGLPPEWQRWVKNGRLEKGWVSSNVRKLVVQAKLRINMIERINRDIDQNAIL